MNLLSDWLNSTKEIFKSAGDFFENEDRRNGFGHPLKFALLSFLLTGLLIGVREIAFGSVEVVALIIPLASNIIGSLIGLGAVAVIIHVLAMLLGGENGFAQTLAALFYSTCVSTIASIFLFIPLIGGVVNIVLGVFAVYVQIKGLEEFQEMNTGRAATAVLLPATIALFLAVLFIFTGVLAIIGAQSQLAGISGAPAIS